MRNRTESSRPSGGLISPCSLPPLDHLRQYILRRLPQHRQRKVGGAERRDEGKGGGKMSRIRRQMLRSMCRWRGKEDRLQWIFSIPNIS